MLTVSAVHPTTGDKKAFLNQNQEAMTQNTGYIDITVEEAWTMLTDSSSSNGIQIPIDVRTDSEWYDERINTPYPEYPRHYELYLLGTQEGVQKFKSLYEGQEIILYCRSGSRSANAAQILVNNDFNGTIYNMLGGITAWRSAGYPTKVGNQVPFPPDTPSGSTTGVTNISYSYSVITTDPDDDAVRYGLDWDGNGDVDEWTEFYPSATPVNISHSWTVPGIYQLQVKAEDIVGWQSGFSSALTVIIAPSSNNAPDTPVIKGPTMGKAGREYEYTFVSTDPDGDDVYYWIEWEKGYPNGEWIGPFSSGDEVTLTHAWDTKGTYTIKAQAKDIYGAESEWGTLEVSMPKTYHIIWSLLEKLNEWIMGGLYSHIKS